MSTQEQHYLTCNGCGEAYRNEYGVTAKGETADCVRAEAEDDSWNCHRGPSEDQDYCPCCEPPEEICKIGKYNGC